MGQRLVILPSPTRFQHKKMLFRSEELNEKPSENKGLGTQRLMPSPKHQTSESYTQSSCSFHWPSTLPPPHQGHARHAKIRSISLPVSQLCALWHLTSCTLSTLSTNLFWAHTVQLVGEIRANAYQDLSQSFDVIFMIWTETINPSPTSIAVTAASVSMFSILNARHKSQLQLLCFFSSPNSLWCSFCTFFNKTKMVWILFKQKHSFS